MASALDPGKFALFAAKRPSIGNIVANCTLTERHGASYQVSTSPVEDGSFLTDHIIREPITLDMTAIFSPYPDNIIDSVRDGQNADTRAVWARIRALADSGVPFRVYTTLQVYDDMVFTAFDHTEQGEDVIRLNASLQQIQIAKTQSDVYIADSVVDNLSTADDVGNPPTSPQ